MAIKNKDKAGQGLIGVSNAILDSLTLDVFIREFEPEFKKIEALKAKIKLCMLQVPKLLIDLEENGGYNEYNSARSALSNFDVEFKVGLKDGNIIRDTKDPLVVTRILVTFSSGVARGLPSRILDYILERKTKSGDTYSLEMLQEEVFEAVKRRVVSQLREFTTGTPRLIDLFSGKVPRQFFTEWQLKEAFLKTPTRIYRTKIETLDKFVPNWPDIFLDILPNNLFNKAIPIARHQIDILNFLEENHHRFNKDSRWEKLVSNMTDYAVEKHEVRMLVYEHIKPNPAYAMAKFESVITKLIEAGFGKVSGTASFYLGKSELNQGKLIISNTWSRNYELDSLVCNYFDYAEKVGMTPKFKYTQHSDGFHREPLTQQVPHILILNDARSREDYLPGLDCEHITGVIDYKGPRCIYDYTLAKAGHNWFNLIARYNYEQVVSFISLIGYDPDMPEHIHNKDASRYLEVFEERKAYYRNLIETHWYEFNLGMGYELEFDKAKYDQFWDNVTCDVYVLELDKPAITIKLPDLVMPV